MQRRSALATATAVLALMGLTVYEQGPDDQVVEVAGETRGPPSSLAEGGPLDRPLLNPSSSAAASTPATVATTVASAGSGTLCVGDSIMLGASPGYYGTLQVCDAADAVHPNATGSGVFAGVITSVLGA